MESQRFELELSEHGILERIFWERQLEKRINSQSGRGWLENRLVKLNKMNMLENWKKLLRCIGGIWQSRNKMSTIS